MDWMFLGMIETGTQKLRLDKWLWAARFYKTRSLATQAISANKVRVNGETVKPAKEVKVGDLLRILAGSGHHASEWEVTIRDLSDKRGGAPIAQTLYAETPESQARRAAEAERRKLYSEPATEIFARPTKRDRRDLDRLMS
jgi:ribosome-associated heat shock protein Hsp15